LTLSVSVVIPTRARHASLPSVLTPLLEDARTDEIVVVVDGDDPLTEHLLDVMSRAEPRIRHVRAQGAGPAAARQAGVEASASEVVLMVDDDVVAGQGLVSGHAARHARASALVVCGAMPVAGNQTASVGTRLYAQSYLRWQLRVEMDPSRLLDQLWGGNVSLRREDCLAVGLDNPAMAGIKGHEDREFGIRCRLAGLQGVYAPELVASHRQERDLEAFRRDCVEMGRGRARLHRIHGSVIGPLPRDAYTEDLPPGLGLVVRAGRTRPGHAAIGRALVAGIGDGTSGRALRLGKLLRRVDLARGAALG
jgi:cellulose synthase/poly-beta-1,6-N-acetylglucosamine synthase-like glycosyltransferase